MTVEPLLVALLLGLYMLALFGLAWFTRLGRLPARLVNNPLVYVLSLGIVINTWSFYPSILSAANRGYGYLAYYLGYSLAFLFAPVFLQPILRITRTYQLSSMADLFAFRFRSPLAGSLTALVLLLCIFPLVALQILAVAESAALLLPGINAHVLAFMFSLLALTFTLSFGASDHAGRDKHQGVVLVLAFETVFKLLVLTALGLFAVFGVFGGFGELDAWLARQPAAEQTLQQPFFETSTNLLMLLFFTAALAMPHMFHMTFKENSNPNYLNIASWGLPLMLLVAALPALPVLWAAQALGSPHDTEYSAIAIGLLTGSPLVALAVFLGGLAGAFGITVVIALALSNICLNHLVLPVHKPATGVNLYDWLLLRRRMLIAAVVLGCFACYMLIAGGTRSTDVGYVSLVACVQFLPGILTLLYWPGANRKGFIAGMGAGLGVWLALGLLPAFTALPAPEFVFRASGNVNWDVVASLSLAANMLCLTAVSLLTSTSAEERTAGAMCSLDTVHRLRRLGLSARSPQEFAERLSRPLGQSIAHREVQRALKDLGLSEDERRPYLIQQLRDQIEANLSGLLGPTIANQIIDRYLPYELVAEGGSLDVSFLESRLEAYPGNLSGVALDLDNLRRHHRQILLDLPLGVCSIGANHEISLWNGAMEELTGLAGSQIVGSYPTSLPEPWKTLLLDFIEDEDSSHVHKKPLTLDGGNRWVSLHKATIDKARKARAGEGLVIVVEDLTETQMLEAELAHAERLASIGRLAAGVAHEIGNPITGIACLAQNIRDETGDADLHQMAQQIIEQTRRTSRIVQSLVSFAHSGEQHSEEETFRQPVSVRACAEEAIQLLSLNPQGKEIRFLNRCADDVLVLTDYQRLQQIFVNLLSNARDASPPGATISVTNSINHARVSIMITDQGCGISADIKDRIFEPFFTTKEPGQGTGLGLALVYSITESLGGSIQVESPVDKVSRKGTRVIVTFPCYHGNALRQVETA